MTRLILLALILAGCSAATAVQPRIYTPIPSSEFVPLPTASGRNGVLQGVGHPETASEPSDPVSAPEPVTRVAGPIPPPSRPPRLVLPTHSITGQSTWWNSWGHGLYAAAGPTLRAAMGPGYLHRYVTACARGRCVRVRLTTSCACSPESRVIDLSLDAFAQLASPSLGILEVEVNW